MVAIPLWFASGVTLTVRFPPLPARTIFPFGISDVLFDDPVTARVAKGVSTSVTVNANAPVELSSLIVWLAIDDIVGRSFIAFTVT